LVPCPHSDQVIKEGQKEGGGSGDSWSGEDPPTGKRSEKRERLGEENEKKINLFVLT